MTDDVGTLLQEYACPDGHLFQIPSPPPESCEVCGRGPLERRDLDAEDEDVGGQVVEFPSVLDAVIEEQHPEFDGDLAGLLNDVRAYIARFIFADPTALDMLALYVLHTHVVDTGRTAVYLNLTSAEPGSGKSTVLEVLELIVRMPISMEATTSVAALFRILDKMPTLLLDEVDTVFSPRPGDKTEDMRGILNSGYRKGKLIFRVANPSSDKVRAYKPFSPKVMAGLRELPPTLAHRCFSIHLRRALPEEISEDFDVDVDEVVTTAESLRQRCEAWAEDEGVEADMRDPIRKPAKLPELDVRRNQLALPLLRIADLAGGDWPRRARVSVISIGADVNASPLHEQGIRLLEAIREAFDGDLLKRDPLECGELVAIMNSEAEYGKWNDGKGITTRQLGHKLRPYGVLARTVHRDGRKLGNGYHRAVFQDVWKRYLPTDDPDPDDGHSLFDGAEEGTGPDDGDW